MIINKKKFEITTLRKDISTDGRHAKVKFTLDGGQSKIGVESTIVNLIGKKNPAQVLLNHSLGPLK